MPALDTFRIVKHLQNAGFSAPWAETVSGVLRATRTTDLRDLVTKTDLDRPSHRAQYLEVTISSG
ncbi:MAG: hypothetical protein FD153_1797 [Rhodospirillaceae bacterium]|nr:MAG: hypothetical protein FD153_1797 [Rhodospirillaceae bacterium]